MRPDGAGVGGRHSGGDSGPGRLSGGRHRIRREAPRRRRALLPLGPRTRGGCCTPGQGVHSNSGRSAGPSAPPCAAETAVFPLPGVRARPGEVQRPGGQERRVLPVRRRGAQGPAMYRRPEVPALHRGWRSCGPQDGWPGVSPPGEGAPLQGEEGGREGEGERGFGPRSSPARGARGACRSPPPPPAEAPAVMETDALVSTPAAKSGARKRKEREESDAPASGASSPTLGNSLKRSGKKKGKGGSSPELPLLLDPKPAGGRRSSNRGKRRLPQSWTREPGRSATRRARRRLSWRNPSRRHTGRIRPARGGRHLGWTAPRGRGENPARAGTGGGRQ